MRGNRAAKVDKNQGEIVAALRAAGYYVCDMSRLGDGFPDILVVDKRGQVVLFEIKTAYGTLTPAEIKFKLSYPGRYYVVRSAEMAIGYLEEDE